MNVRQTIGWNLRRLRVERGFSQERLALTSGIDRSYLGRIERGSENVTVGTLEARKKKLEKMKVLWEKQGWVVTEVFDGSFAKNSYIIVEGTEENKPAKKMNVIRLKEEDKPSTSEELKLEKILQQVEALKIKDTYGTKKEIRSLAEVLGDDENILGLTSGIMDGSTWLIVCTPERVILLDKGMLYGLTQKEFSLEKISSIEFKQGFAFGELNITVSSSNIEIKNAENESVKAFVNAVKKAIKELKAANTQTSNSSHGQTDLVTKLKELSELKEAGILSDSEFQTAKEKLLA